MNKRSTSTASGSKKQKLQTHRTPVVRLPSGEAVPKPNATKPYRKGL